MPLLIFIFGLIIGSFLNCVIYRMRENKSFLKGRSFCPNCKHALSAADLVPVFSFVFLKAKCRYCSKKISWQYPLVEFFTGIVFAVLYLKFGWHREFFVYALYSVFLILIFVYDLKYYLVLDKVSLPAILAGLAGSLFLGMKLTDLVIGGIIGLGFFLIQFAVSKGKWIGGGDLRLGLMAGFMVGWPKILPLIFITYITGAIGALGMLALKKKRWGDAVPLGIFISFAVFIVLLFGDKIISWYIG